MAMTDAEQYEVARELVDRIFVQPGVTAHADLDDLKAAVGAIDTAMNATTTQVEAAYPGVVTKTAFLSYAQAQASGLTAQEAGVALALWALKEVGLL